MTAIAISILLAGCYANVGTSGGVQIPKDAASTCSNHCASIGLSLDSVVIMASNVGCVCRGPKNAAGREDGAVSAGGMAALIVQQQQQQQQPPQAHR
jgi:hypothetical protein